jgi:hypothetical protein
MLNSHPMEHTRTMTRKILSYFVLVALPGVVACGGSDAPDAASEEVPAESPAPAPVDAPMTVVITAPAQDSEVDGGSVLVTLEAEGFSVVPAGDQTPRSGHHHLIVNADLPPMDAPIPVVEGQYIHMGAGQTELALTDLAPGEYTVIALVGDFAHVPLDPPVADTVHFVVRE